MVLIPVYNDTGTGPGWDSDDNIYLNIWQPAGYIRVVVHADEALRDAATSASLTSVLRPDNPKKISKSTFAY